MFKKIFLLKYSPKKINFLFFFDSDKAKHFQLSFVWFRIFIAFLLCTSVFCVCFSLYGIHALKESRKLEAQLLGLKSYAMNEYFESHLGSGSPAVSVASHKLEKSEDLTGAPSVAMKTPVSPELKHAREPGIKVENISTSRNDGNFLLSFSLVSEGAFAARGVTTGSVCAVLTDEKGNYSGFPANITPADRMPTVAECAGGERVKFSRLRPVKMNFNAAGSLKPKKISIYFMNAGSSTVTLLKELKNF